MRRTYFLGIAILLTIAFVAIVALLFERFFLGGWTTAFPLPPETHAHLYNDIHVDVGHPHIKVVYVVPKDRASVVNLEWRNILERTFDEVQRFHTMQFRGASYLSFDIFSAPVLLSHDSSFYDDPKSRPGNPAALISIAEEIDRRVFEKDGDLYSDEFVAFDREKDYPVLALVYDGVGAVGGKIYDSPLNSVAEIAKELGVSEEEVYKVTVKSVDGFFLLNMRYLTDPELSSYGSTSLYHEFAHSLGIPDGYHASDAGEVDTTDDIMGGGRRTPFRANYLDNETIQRMGVF